jgi:outer membrane protein assembly factor BamB
MAAPPAAEWTSSRADPQNRAEVVLAAPASGTPRAWSFEGSGRVYGYVPGMTVWSPPALAVVEGRAVLFAGSYDHSIYALDAAGGEVLWKVATGDGVYAAPVVARRPGRTLVFVPSSDRMLYALDASTGARAWIHGVAEYRPTLGGARLGSPCLGESRGQPALFLPWWAWDASLGQSQQDSGLTALNPDDGRVLWTRRLGDNELTAALCARTAGGSRVFVGSSDGNLFALDAAEGRELWRRTEVDAVRAPPAVSTSGGFSRLVTASKSGIVRGLDPDTGTEAWRYRTGDWVTSAPVIATIDGRHLALIGSYDRNLYALDLLAGTLVWRFHAPAGIHAPPALSTTGRPLVLTTAWDHHLHGIDARSGAPRFSVYTGRPLWDAIGLESSSWSAPVVGVVNGVPMVFVGSYDGKLYAFVISELENRYACPRASWGFWLSFPLSLTAVGVVAWLMTRRHRRRRAGSGP